MNGKEINGRVINVGVAQKRAERMNNLKSRYELLKMERLDDAIGDGALRKEFSPYGTITSAKVHE